MKTVIIDNYDSFTYNLYHLIRDIGVEAAVVRNNLFAMEDIAPYDKIVLSPGPGIPKEAGLLTDVIRTFAGQKPILGVCLGHQAIGEVFGARLTHLSEVFHGIQSCCRITGKDYIFNNISEEFTVGRYHSWVVDKDALPHCLAVTAVSPEGHIMALRHHDYDIHGIQFHPESVLTPDGRIIMENFLLHNEPQELTPNNQKQ